MEKSLKKENISKLLLQKYAKQFSFFEEIPNFCLVIFWGTVKWGDLGHFLVYFLFEFHGVFELNKLG
jgi:hypothetical protein